MTINGEIEKTKIGHGWYFISTSQMPLAVRRAFREEPNEAERFRGYSATDIPVSDEVVRGTVVEKVASVIFEGYKYMQVVVVHNHTHDNAFSRRKL